MSGLDRPQKDPPQNGRRWDEAEPTGGDQGPPPAYRLCPIHDLAAVRASPSVYCTSESLPSVKISFMSS